MRLYVGTSGYSYPGWKGHFYPTDLPDAEMLRYYAERLPCVEVNNTFYRMPKQDVVDKWAADVPDGFRFVVKASRRITHFAKLADCQDALGFLWRSLERLGDKLGAVLFQMPPYFRKDVTRLSGFLATLPAGMRPVFEFRHKSWFDDEAYECLRAGGAALCVSDRAGELDIVSTADFGYFRLREPEYGDDELERLAATIRAREWSEVFAFFKHEEAGAGAKLAVRFRDVFTG